MYAWYKRNLMLTSVLQRGMTLLLVRFNPRTLTLWDSGFHKYPSLQLSSKNWV